MFLLDVLDKSPQYRAVDGAVLVFLPGLAHIQQLYDLLSTDKRFRVKDRYILCAVLCLNVMPIANCIFHVLYFTVRFFYVL